MSKLNETQALAVGGVNDGRCTAFPHGARCNLRNGHPGDCRSYPTPPSAHLHPVDYDLARSVATAPLPDIDAARTRHRSACEGKRRKAWWVGFWWGAIATTTVTVVVHLLAALLLP